MTPPTKANKKKSRRNLTVVLITTITVLTWIGFEAYRSFVTTKVKPEIRELITPLDPTLETETIESLEKKTGYTREQLKNDLSTPLVPIIVESKEEETGDETEEVVEEGGDSEATATALPAE